jgi:tRNA(Ile)-lysidine synthase
MPSVSPPQIATSPSTRSQPPPLLAMTIIDALERSGLRSPATLVLVGVSGGPDSVSLLHLLTRVENGPRLHVAHLDHGLREESAGDAFFVRELCREWGVAVTVEQRDVRQARKAGSLEDAARRVRYGFFAEVAAANGAEAVAVGHTADDQVETVLLHMARGAGLEGLAGMGEDMRRNDGLRVVRPLLSVTKAETLAYCEAQGILYRQDASNASMRFVRNRVRHKLLPALRAINPNVDEALLRLAETARGEADYWRVEAGRLLDLASVSQTHRSLSLSQSVLRDLHPAALRHLLRAAVERLTGSLQGFETVHLAILEGLVEGGAGRHADLPGFTAGTEHELLLLRIESPGAAASIPETDLRVPGDVTAGGWRIVCDLPARRRRSQGVWRAMLDLERAGAPLRVRSRRPGDRYQPSGMTGTKKLQDLMVDAGIPRRLRDAVPVIEGASGIAWCGGYRIAEQCKVTAESKTVAEIRLEPLDAGPCELVNRTIATL